MPDEKVAIPYYPFKKMLDPAFIKSLPEISMFNVVNNGRTIKDQDGNWATDIMISHVGFLVKENDRLTIYHSTNLTDAGLAITTLEDFSSFLARRFINNSKTTAVGLNLLEVTAHPNSNINID